MYTRFSIAHLIVYMCYTTLEASGHGPPPPFVPAHPLPPPLPSLPLTLPPPAHPKDGLGSVGDLGEDGQVEDDGRLDVHGAECPLAVPPTPGKVLVPGGELVEGRLQVGDDQSGMGENSQYMFKALVRSHSQAIY